MLELDDIEKNNPFIINEITAKLSLGYPKLTIFVMATEGYAKARFGFPVNSSARLGVAFDINDLFKK